PAEGKTSERTRRHAERDFERGQNEPHHAVSAVRSRAITRALRRERHDVASHAALAKQAREQAGRRSAKQRSEIGPKAAGPRLAHQSPAERRAIARKAARTRAANRSR